MSDNYDIVAGFNRISAGYDAANDAMTFGMHRAWRQRLIRAACQSSDRGAMLLDLATGTADVAIGIAKLRPDLKIKALDPAIAMLDIARRKIETKKILPVQIDLIQGDARHLEFPDNFFDTVTVSWGIRNVVPFEAGLREIYRVLKPGGTLLILESGRPEYPLLGKLYRIYAGIVPYIGGGISGYLPAYKYYIKSSDTFPGGAEFSARLAAEGYTSISYRCMGFGLIFLYSARKGGTPEVN